MDNKKEFAQIVHKVQRNAIHSRADALRTAQAKGRLVRLRRRGRRGRGRGARGAVAAPDANGEPPAAAGDVPAGAAPEEPGAPSAPGDTPFARWAAADGAALPEDPAPPAPCGQLQSQDLGSHWQRHRRDSDEASRGGRSGWQRSTGTQRA